MKTRRVTKKQKIYIKNGQEPEDLHAKQTIIRRCNTKQNIYMRTRRLSEGVTKKKHLFNDMPRQKPDVYQQESQNEQNVFMNNL